MLYALRGSLRAAVGRLTAREYRDTAKVVKRRSGPANGLYGGLAFWDALRPAGHGRKMPPGGHRRPHKRRGDAGEYRDIAAHAGRPGGQKKARPGQLRAGDGGIQDFFAVSQIIIKGRIKINRIITRCTSFQREAPRRASAPDGRQCASGLNHRSARRPLACTV